MGRSVSYPSESQIVLFTMEEDTDDVFSFEDNLDNFKDLMTAKLKSLGHTNVWLGNEDHAILENNLAYFGISEYCGVLSLWAVPKEDFLNLSKNWLNQVYKTFQVSVESTFGNIYQKISTASNGEAFFRKLENG